MSPKYLPMVWQILQRKKTRLVRSPSCRDVAGSAAPRRDQPEAVRAQCVEMRDFVVKIRSHTAMQFAAPVVKGLPAGSQPLLNWKLRSSPRTAGTAIPTICATIPIRRRYCPTFRSIPDLHQEAAPRWAALSAKARAGDTDLIVPAAQRSRYEAAFARFASVFPDAFYIKERGRYFPDDSQDKGRLLSAGYHSVMGFFRDDTPLMELILDEKGQKELDRLWDEFDFIADFTARTWTQYFFNQSGEVQGKGAEAGSPRPPDHEITDTAVIMAMRDAYLAKAAADPNNDPVRSGGDPRSLSSSLTPLFEPGERASRTRAEASGRASPVCRARLPAAAYQERSATTCWPITTSFGRRTNCRMKMPSAMPIVSVLMSPDFLYRHRPGRFRDSRRTDAASASLKTTPAVSEAAYPVMPWRAG